MICQLALVTFAGMGEFAASSMSSVDSLSGAAVFVRLCREDCEALLAGRRLEIRRDAHGEWADEPVAKVTIEMI